MTTYTAKVTAGRAALHIDGGPDIKPGETYDFINPTNHVAHQLEAAARSGIINLKIKRLAPFAPSIEQIKNRLREQVAEEHPEWLEPENPDPPCPACHGLPLEHLPTCREYTDCMPYIPNDACGGCSRCMSLQYPQQYTEESIAKAIEAAKTGADVPDLFDILKEIPSRFP